MLLEQVNQDMITRALQCGADDYITSPIDMNLLERRLAALSIASPSRRTQEFVAALRESEIRYATLFEKAPIAIYSKNHDGCYTSANAFCLTYYPPGGPVGCTDDELFSPEIAAALRAADLEVMNTGQELELEETIPTAQGTRVVLSRKVPLRNADGEVEGILGISEDITERKKVEEALKESNQRFQALFEHSPDAIFLLDPKPPGIIVDCNDVACRMNGYSREELIGHSIQMLDSEDGFVVPEEGMNYTDWVRSKGNVQVEMVHRRKDGTTFPIEVSTCLLTIGDHERILGIDRDITERHLMKIAEREQRVLAEALRDTALALNSTLRLDEVLDRILTQAARVVPHETSSIGLIEDGYVRIVRCKGFAERGLEQATLSMRFPLAEDSHFASMISSRQPIVVDDVWTCPGWFTTPAWNWIRGHMATPIIVGANEVIGFLHFDSSKPGTFTTEHARNLQIFASQVAIAIQNAQHTHELERRVREGTAELRRALIREHELSEIKSRFLTTASHEFRTPMSIMMTSSELLKNYYERMTSEQRQERLNQIQIEIKNMTALLDDILKVNKTVDSGPQQVNPGPVDVADFCRNLLLKLSFLQNRSVELVCASECGTVMLDEHLVTDILTSLLSNAVKYSKSDQVVRFEVTCDDEELSFTIQDHGIGIPDEDQERVFDVFHRGQNVKNTSGTGLGLTIAKQSADLHGGKLTFTSKVGMGTTFTLMIPKHFMKELS
jgi:PAS domain S-box-containing protein